jgi:hypothetical protein
VDNATLLRMLEEALDRLGVTIRVEAMPEESRISGGLCAVKGKYSVIISPRANTAEQVEVLLDALRQLDTESIWLPPFVRERISNKS